MREIRLIYNDVDEPDFFVSEQITEIMSKCYMTNRKNTFTIPLQKQMVVDKMSYALAVKIVRIMLIKQ